jgi:SagB-type dehydrogenase family enzyme
MSARVTDRTCTELLQWALPQLGRRSTGYRKVHALVCKRLVRWARALAPAELGQEEVAHAPCVLVFAAVLARTTRKDGERGVRYVHMEAGHAAQNVLLTATALGLAAYPVGAFEDARVAEMLRLGRGEAPVYLVPVGAPRFPVGSER